MIPKFLWRGIGGVNILELSGVFTEPWVSRSREEMLERLEEEPSPGLLFNLREVEKLDRRGAEAILELVHRPVKSALLGQNLSISVVAEHMRADEFIPIFERPREAIVYFSKEFALAGRNFPKERRLFPRIKTALPVEFELEEFGQPFFFEAVVTNLSQGGFYSYFLDSPTEVLASRMVDPFDLKLLKIRLSLPDNEIVEIEGKALRSEKDSAENHGLAVEFYNLEPEKGAQIGAFLNREGEPP